MNRKFHLSLDVADLEASVRFYSTLLNSPPSKLKPGYAKFELESPALNLTIQEKSHCCLQGISHMGLRVDTVEEIEAIKRRLEDAGYSTADEENVICCYALQDKFWVNDPSDYRWEVYIVKADTEEESRPSVPKACCS
jgi:catechol 2,3-dioxygenase-like lactoylglutathione lyase family enzyme